jgi:hypothetical protein
MATNCHIAFEGLMVIVRDPRSRTRQPLAAVPITAPKHGKEHHDAEGHGGRTHHDGVNMAHVPEIWIRSDLACVVPEALARKSPDKPYGTAQYARFALDHVELRFPRLKDPIPVSHDPDTESHVQAAPPRFCGAFDDDVTPLSRIADLNALSSGKLLPGVASRDGSGKNHELVTARVVLAGGHMECSSNTARSRVFWSLTGDAPDEVHTIADTAVLRYEVGTSNLLLLDAFALENEAWVGRIAVEVKKGNGPEVVVTSVPEESDSVDENGFLVHFALYYNVCTRTGPTPKYYRDCTKGRVRHDLRAWKDDLKLLRSDPENRERTSTEGPCPPGGGEP